MLSLTAVQAEVERLAALIGASGYVLPTFGHSEDGARPHIEIDARGYHFVIVERGEERRRVTTLDSDELLYQVFEAVTFSLASDYELANRLENQDCRRVLFRRQIELLHTLSATWAERESADHNRVLREHPFDDVASIRARLTAQLREHGYTADAAWHSACERYPLPKT